MDFSTATFYSFLIFSAIHAIEDQQKMTVKPGDDVTLQCQSPGGKAVTLLEWSRPDLKKDGYVFFYKDGSSNEKYQHPSFLGRVQLRDAEMKNGDVSVILKNININDTGTYQCRIVIRDTEGITETKDVIQLTVTLDEEDEDEGQKDGPNRIVVGLSVTAVLLFLLLGIFSFIYIRKRKEATRTSYQPPAETGSVPQHQ